MPLYEFSCAQCGKESEILVRGRDWKGTPCPHCGSKKLTKKLSVFAATHADSTSDLPSCSGNPGSCGRCTDGM